MTTQTMTLEAPASLVRTLHIVYALHALEIGRAHV
jgi:hypothetical protein